VTGSSSLLVRRLHGIADAISSHACPAILLGNRTPGAFSAAFKSSSNPVVMATSGLDHSSAVVIAYHRS
jgi:hypothetical protein